MRKVSFDKLEPNHNLDLWENQYIITRWDEDEEALVPVTGAFVMRPCDPGASGLLWTYSSILRTLDESVPGTKLFSDAAEQLAERATEWQRSLE